ncbi:hypothetical protein A152_0023780 [Vibrio tasmaniensis 1F-187]|uniref:Uncharacterized protein n=1 Tax=Vibrio tasmaniensis TaxID=212663 RepID=A0A0H3ZP89_9VIBR|nr:hypothetical protein [Vibrio tasmaniensis]AKN36247.1 hypothetical protein [Vibrio tasmaniensis]OEF69664.1 hypothetical protein A152_02285 [Vibrio tasmaniensis 1F-187]
MDIQVDIKHVVDDLRCVKVSLYEFTNQKGKNVDVMIWVPNCDSISEIELAAKKTAIAQLKVALSSLDKDFE